MTERHGTREPRPVTAPAPAVSGKARSAEWVLVTGSQARATRRPAPAPAPAMVFGHDAAGVKWEQPDGGTIRVTVEEAAALQGFRPDYPWHGSESSRFQQIGDAVPPLLAVAALGHLLGLDWQPICRGET